MPRIFLATIGSLLILGFAGAASAFECPGHITAAESAIAELTAAMNALPDGEKKGLVHVLRDQANALLSGAKHNHDVPAAGGYAHALAIAKADSALAYANAALVLVAN